MTMWTRIDPREVVGKRANIVVSDGNHAAFASVETHHGWHVDLGDMVGGHTFIGENDKWPETFYWAYPPGVRGPTPDFVVVDEMKEYPK